MEEPRFVLAAYPDQFRIEIIEFGGEMGRRPRRHAAPDRAAVDDDHRTAEAAELIGGGKAGNSRADYDYVATGVRRQRRSVDRSEEHTSELQSLMRNSYAVFCLKKKKQI